MFLSKCTLKFSDLLSRCSVWIAMGMSPKSLESPHVDGPVARICPIHKGWFIYIIKGWKSVIFKLWRYWSKLPWYRRICNLELSLWISKAYLPRSEDKFSLFLFDLVPWGFQNHTYALRCEKYVFYLCICIHIDLYIYIPIYSHMYMHEKHICRFGGELFLNSRLDLKHWVLRYSMVWCGISRGSHRPSQIQLHCCGFSDIIAVTSLKFNIDTQIAMFETRYVLKTIIFGFNSSEFGCVSQISGVLLMLSEIEKSNRIRSGINKNVVGNSTADFDGKENQERWAFSIPAIWLISEGMYVGSTPHLGFQLQRRF